MKILIIKINKKNSPSLKNIPIILLPYLFIGKKSRQNLSRKNKKSVKILVA